MSSSYLEHWASTRYHVNIGRLIYAEKIFAEIQHGLAGKLGNSLSYPSCGIDLTANSELACTISRLEYSVTASREAC